MVTISLMRLGAASLDDDDVLTVLGCVARELSPASRVVFLLLDLSEDTELGAVATTYSRDGVHTLWRHPRRRTTHTMLRRTTTTQPPFAPSEARRSHQRIASTFV